MKRRKRKRKISFLKVLIVFLLVYLIITGIYSVVTVRIKNIYVIGNNYLSDKYIIDKALLSDYPPFFLTSSSKIKKNLKTDSLIYDVRVKKSLFSVYLYVSENTPLFFDSVSGYTILKSGSVLNKFDVPVLNNYIPDTLYSDFIEKMSNVSVINRISEIEYMPNDVDSKRFYLIMDDGNIVYLTLDDFLKINDYVEIIKTLNGKKGILYWDSGNYFEIKEQTFKKKYDIIKLEEWL